MYHRSLNLNEPKDNNLTVWRFMDFPSFINLVTTRSLFFRLVSKQIDPFEGTIPSFNVLNRDKLYPNLNSDEVIKLNSVLKQLTDYNRNQIYVNCWHINDFESAAMWHIYSDYNHGIAIKSSTGRLKQCFHETEQIVSMNLVKYLDYNSNWMSEGNMFSPFIHKRASFQHENELRLIFHDILQENNQENLDGINIKVDLNFLIDSIYISPKSEAWITNLVTHFLDSQSLNFPVAKSELYTLR